jgi:hypothetical protein
MDNAGSQINENRQNRKSLQHHNGKKNAYVIKTEPKKKKNLS